jgi:hypothetical protein
MKTDFYTKLVLTIIAVCLMLMVFRDVPVISTAAAQDSPAVTDVNIVSISGRALDGDYSARKRIPSLPVEVRQ